MRVVKANRADLPGLSDEAQPRRSVPSAIPAVSLEKIPPPSEHTRGAILGDKTANVIDLKRARTASVQRRHQKSGSRCLLQLGLPQKLSTALRRVSRCAWRKEIRYDQCGTIAEFSVRPGSKHLVFHRNENPRIRLTHGKLRVITGRISFARQATECTGDIICKTEVGMPGRPRWPVRLRHSMQGRTDDGGSGNKFTPITERFGLTVPRAAFGIRLDGGMGYDGAETRFTYDTTTIRSWLR